MEERVSLFSYSKHGSREIFWYPRMTTEEAENLRNKYLEKGKGDWAAPSAQTYNTSDKEAIGWIVKETLTKKPGYSYSGCSFNEKSIEEFKNNPTGYLVEICEPYLD